MLARCHQSPPSGVYDAAMRAGLDAALKSGALLTPEYTAKRAILEREAGTVTALKTRERGGKVVLDTNGMWIKKRGPYVSKAAAAADRINLGDRDNDGKWIYNEDKGYKGWFRCNAHVDCPVQMKATEIEGEWWLVVLSVSHSTQIKTKARKNQALDNDMLAHVVARAKNRDSAFRIYNDLIMESVTRVFEGRSTAEKRPRGGMTGACMGCWPHIVRTHLDPPDAAQFRPLVYWHEHESWHEHNIYPHLTGTAFPHLPGEMWGDWGDSDSDSDTSLPDLVDDSDTDDSSTDTVELSYKYH